MNYRRAIRDRRHARLLATARAGDTGAFHSLYHERAGPVARYLHSRVTSHADAEDVFSVVFHRFLERLDSYDTGRGSVLAWLLTMAHSALVDHHRRQRPAVPVEEVEDVLSGSIPSPLDEVLRDEQARYVHKLVERLPADTRRMLSLRFGEDLGHRDIAACMGLNEAAVKQRFSRTIRMLRERLLDRASEGKAIDYAL